MELEEDESKYDDFWKELGGKHPINDTLQPDISSPNKSAHTNSNGNGNSHPGKNLATLYQLVISPAEGGNENERETKVIAKALNTKENGIQLVRELLNSNEIFILDAQQELYLCK